MSTYYDEKLCNNFIKSVLHRPSDKDLYVCGTYAFTPRLFQFSYDLNLVKEDDGYGYCSLNPLDSSTAIWIDNGNPGAIPSLYSASLLDASTKTQPVEPVIYRPELKRGDKTFQYLRTPKFDSDWLYQPTFIASFDVDDYVFIFLKEKSIEQIAEGQDVYYSRVVRICKSDMGSVNLGNQWTSLRKSRLTCVYNNTYLNDLEDIIRVDENSFVGLFSIKLPGKNSVSFLCEFQKQALVNTLNAPADNFKELTPGTQYWSKLPAGKVPKNIPNQCNYNSQQLKDDALNFLKSHCLIGDHIEGTVINFLDQHVTSIAVDVIDSISASNMAVSMSNLKSGNDGGNFKALIYYLGTADGKVVKVSNLDSNLVISEWKVANERIDQMKIRKGSSLFVATDASMYQVNLLQCKRYYVCSTCMNDPYCGWNIRKNVCEEATPTATNLITLNPSLCSRFQKQENVKTLQIEANTNLKLECNILDAYLYDHVEWRKDSELIDVKSSASYYLTTEKDLLILSGNSSQAGLYSCYVDKTELMISYSLTYKQAPESASKTSPIATSTNQKCITAESYIRQYNNWCDEFTRYQRALNEWEDLKEKTCSTNSAGSSGSSPYSATSNTGGN